MGDQALGIAEIVADADDLERVLEPERGGLASFDLEGHKGRAPTHLPAHDLRLRMVRSAGIDQARYLRMFGQGDRDGRRSEEHTSELQSRLHLVCRLLLEK